MPNEILIIAVIGAANNTPIMPHIIPQKISDKIIVIGCRPKASPNIFGSNMLPIIIWTTEGNKIIINICVNSGNCKTAIGSGRSTAITDPITGIKFKIKVRVPKIKASSKPKNQ